MTHNSDIPDEIKHLADAIGHLPESVIILDAVVRFVVKTNAAAVELNQVLCDIMTKMDNLSPELQAWLNEAIKQNKEKTE